MIHGTWLKYKLKQPEERTRSDSLFIYSLALTGVHWRGSQSPRNGQSDGHFHLSRDWTAAVSDHISIGTTLKVRHNSIK